VREMPNTNTTLDLFQHPFTGEELRDGGIKVAVDHADQVHESWSNLAYDILKAYIKNRFDAFMCEDVRKYAKEQYDLPDAPTARAWGGVILRAKGAKLIKCIGTAPVNNPKAHKANASRWVAV
jgi:hypothetical protein